MKVTLYDLTDSYINIKDLLDEETNEDLVKILDEIDEEIEIKADNIAKLIKEFEGEANTLDEEIKRLQAKKATKVNSIRNLKLYLENQMIKVGKTKFKTTLFSFGIQKNVPSLKIENEDNIPEDFIKIMTSIDKRELLKAMKEGLEVEGVEITQSESLRIR